MGHGTRRGLGFYTSKVWTEGAKGASAVRSASRRGIIRPASRRGAALGARAWLGTNCAPHFVMRSALFAALLLGCGPTLPTPPATAVPDGAYVDVPHPPPPARPEEIPERPTDAAVWLDGRWSWDRGHWIWERGAWYDAPPGYRYAPTATRWTDDGTPQLAAGHWRRDGEAVDAPEALVRARPQGGVVVDEVGTPVEKARTPRSRRRRGGRRARSDGN